MSIVRVAAVSDLHGNLEFAVPQCDILAIAGDICPVNESHHPVHQQHWLDKTFYPWCLQQVASGKVSQVVFTPGNHDFVFQNAAPTQTPQGVTCLIDSEVTIQGLRIWGSPWSNKFGNWAFMANEASLAAKFAKIPEGLDILLSHGPAYGVCDTILKPKWAGCSEEPLGSKSLRKALDRAKPHWTFCGHIHTGEHEPQGIMGVGVVANVSLLDESYAPAYPVLVVEMEVED